MKDDYLWDGSGESDPEIEKLESLLGRYRSEQPAPSLPEVVVVPFRPRRRAVLLPYAAAAAVAVLSLGVASWWMSHRSTNRTPEMVHSTPAPAPRPGPTKPGGETPAPPVVTPPVVSPPIHHGPRVSTRPRDTAPVVASAPTKVSPLVDVTTADHLEQAELLLRSVRNASAEDADSIQEIAYDAQQSRALLDQNELLRRSAAAKKNLAVGQLLGDLEPFLIDIANLGDRPSRDDLRDVQQRLEQREMLSNLELYSMNRPTQGF